ncbi:aminopeptidase [Acetobacterium woodii]|uniref:Aminopeptidase n=1 Tax=Acetobacterium woodii (strain ATCC 29683 / DSM 1030 / JCM 2381 / KCTC 1655 / WB1) TaxID=931626 RepID=H6LDB3_ACEWD|nr:aminopeptidase [Acetobacterium woodii]AFA49158.1 aminopeptidase [Acetobacterium woodii DSM 1030]
MRDPRLIKYAQTLVNYSLYVKKDEWIVIRGSELAMPLIKECYREILKAGAHPTIMLNPEGISEILLTAGNDAQLQFNSPLMMTVYSQADKVLNILGDHNLKSLSAIPSERIALQRRSGAPITKIYNDRVAAGLMDWTLCLYPTESGAQEANMSLSDYEDFVFAACLINQPDPIAAWQKIHDEQERMIDYLNTKTTFHIVSQDTDLTLSTENRRWINSDGHHNFPSGEVFTAPVRESVNGVIRFTFPGIYSGQEIEDIRLTFKDGKVVAATAKRGQELLQSLLKTDEGSQYVGEFAIGTNYGITQFTKNMLFDEKIGGTIHLALGKSYPECGPINDSLLHWDMLCNMKNGGKIAADGQLFYQNGQFIK